MLVADFSNLCRDSPGKFLGGDSGRKKFSAILFAAEEKYQQAPVK
jgi:hypothetical protein